MTTEITALIQLIHTLRGDQGCPWDRKQTAQSMAVYLVEEVYELLDAIESGTVADICEELGDVLFQVLFVACIYETAGHFTLAEAAEKSRKKMVSRHPHVFGDEKVASARQVKAQWNKIKGRERAADGKTSILDSIPRKLPALMRAYRVSDRAAGNGFDWDDIHGVMAKAEEEWSEFKNELAADAAPRSEKAGLMLEFGDILFTLVNVGRFARLHPETALSASTKKFERRFRFMEERIHAQGRKLEGVSRSELERLWEKAKEASG